MRSLRFYKEPSGAWYVDLPEWTGARAELLMVSGADTLLDIIGQGKREVVVETDLEPFDGSSELLLQNMGGAEGGGHYRIKKLGERYLDLPLWLCDVTDFVFGHIPEKIYIRPVPERSRGTR